MNWKVTKFVATLKPGDYSVQSPAWKLPHFSDIYARFNGTLVFVKIPYKVIRDDPLMHKSGDYGEFTQKESFNI